MCAFIPHLFLRTCTLMCSLFGERKGLRYNIFPLRVTRKTITKLSDHRRRGITHISHIRHHTHMRTSIRLNIRQVPSLLQEVLPRKTTTTLQISPLSKDFKSLHRNQTFTSSFDSHRFVLCFLLFSFPLFTSFIFILLNNFGSPLFFSFHIIPWAASHEMFFMHGLVFSYGVTLFLGNSPLSLRIFFFARFHQPFCAIKPSISK